MSEGGFVVKWVPDWSKAYGSTYESDRAPLSLFPVTPALGFHLMNIPLSLLTDKTKEPK